MGAREDTDLLNGLPIHEVGRMLGLNLPARGMVRCPFKWHKDNNASFQISKDGFHWVCYGCNETGGSIDLVKVYQGWSFMQAKQWLAEKSGLGKSNWQQSSQAIGRRPTYKKVESPPEAPADESLPDHELYSSCLERSPLELSGKLYLRSRGISCEIIRRFSIGQMPGASMIRNLIEDFGFSRVEAAGLLTTSSTQSRYWPMLPEGFLLFPYFEMGRVTYLQARNIKETNKKDRWRNLNHRHSRLYNTDVLADRNIRRIAICEGATDVLSATQLGCEAIGLGGVSSGLSESQIIMLRGKQVDLLLDWDQAGEKRAATLSKELKRFGVATTRKSAPASGATDVNDCLREGYKRI